MKIGITSLVASDANVTLDKLVQDIKIAEEMGFSFYSMPNIFGLDSISALSMAGVSTSTIELIPGVVPATPRHPAVMAQQAMTANLAVKDRFTLGIGISHQLLIEGMLGLPYNRLASRMEEYLLVLNKLLNGELVDFDGEHYKVSGLKFSINNGCGVPLLLAALGPKMLELAVSQATGTITWMAGIKTLSEFIVPSVEANCQKYAVNNNRVVALLPISLAKKTKENELFCEKTFAIYGSLPVYKALMSREGASKPSDVALIGSEDELRVYLRQLADAGVTDFGASVFGQDEETMIRTREFIASEINEEGALK